MHPERVDYVVYGSVAALRLDSSGKRIQAGDARHLGAVCPETSDESTGESRADSVSCLGVSCGEITDLMMPDNIADKGWECLKGSPGKSLVSDALRRSGRLAGRTDQLAALKTWRSWVPGVRRSEATARESRGESALRFLPLTQPNVSVTIFLSVLRELGEGGAMSDLARFSISLQAALLKRFDRLAKDEGYPTRSEAVKALIRRALTEKEWAAGREVAGAIALVYDHHGRRLMGRLVDVQHDFGGVVVAAQHVHLDHHNCLEIIVVRGPVEEIRQLVAKLKSVKGVKDCQLMTTTTGKGI